jgi:hypothetical protein
MSDKIQSAVDNACLDNGDTDDEAPPSQPILRRRRVVCDDDCDEVPVVKPAVCSHEESDGNFAVILRPRRESNGSLASPANTDATITSAAKLPRGSKRSRCGQQRRPRTIQREQV